MKLKDYQQKALEILREYFSRAFAKGAEVAYNSMYREKNQTELQELDFNPREGAYVPLPGTLESAPYVCLRIPTGGGKTLLAAHAIDIIRAAYLAKEFPFVVWLAPTTTICEQTINSLKDTDHPCRQILDENFGGRVRIFNIADVSQINPTDLRNSLCIVVGTMQSLRVEKTEGRKVYQPDEELFSHFENLPDPQGILERDDKGKIIPSFANLLKLHAPLVIMDEAHTSITELSREALERIGPAAVLELTATPREDKENKHNVLHSVPAGDLSSENMIKIPILLSTQEDWRLSIQEACARRNFLEECAEAEHRETGKYIRPITLIQATPKNQDITVEEIYEYLTDNIKGLGIPKEQVVIATGDQDDLTGINLLSPECEIRCIITVQKLREGWDCSFAYVFCSVSKVRKAPNLEQFLGRVLRMPYAERRKNEALNKAYCYISDPETATAAARITDSLVKHMGFSKPEARAVVQAPLKGTEEEGFGDLYRQSEKSIFISTTQIPQAEKVKSQLRSAGFQATDDTTKNETTFVTRGFVTKAASEFLRETIPENKQEELIAKIEQHNATFSPAERKVPFWSPYFMGQVAGEFVLIYPETYMEEYNWSLCESGRLLTRDEFRLEKKGERYEIYIDNEEVKRKSVSEEIFEKLELEEADLSHKTKEELITFLDGQLFDAEFSQDDLRCWLEKVIDSLLEGREGEAGYPLEELIRRQYALAARLKLKIRAIVRDKKQEAWDAMLLPPSPEEMISKVERIDFKLGMYGGVEIYEGSHQFNKHYLPEVYRLKNSGEEHECAVEIDKNEQVEFWLRNVENRRESFWLPLARSKFYPDFVVRLKDGRILIIEYKGKHIATNEDTQNKEKIGEAWEKSDPENRLFLMIKDEEEDGKSIADRIREKIGKPTRT